MKTSKKINLVLFIAEIFLLVGCTNKKELETPKNSTSSTTSEQIPQKKIIEYDENKLNAADYISEYISEEIEFNDENKSVLKTISENMISRYLQINFSNRDYEYDQENFNMRLILWFQEIKLCI